MPTIIPTVTMYSNGVVTVVSTDSTPYSSIVQSMGSYVYGVDGIYMKTNSNTQILEGFTIESYDVNGYINSYVEKPTIDPYQYQTSKFFKLAKNNVVLNGQTTFDFNLLPNEVVYLGFYTTEISVKDYLAPNHFLEIDFFKDFKNVI